MPDKNTCLHYCLRHCITILFIVLWSVFFIPIIIMSIAREGFFELHGGSTKLVRIGYNELNFAKNLSSIDSKESGDMMCISNNRVIRFDQGLDDSIEGDKIYNCFEEDGRLYISTSSNKNAITTPCYFEGKGIITKGYIPRRDSTRKDRTVCALGLSNTKLNEPTPLCTTLSTDLFGSFYTDFDTAKIIEEEEIAACIVQVSTVLTMLVFGGYCCLPIVYLVHLAILCLCPTCKYKRVASAVIFLYEVVLLIISVILPYLYRTTNLRLHPPYIPLLVGNGIILIVMFIWVAFAQKCRKGQKVQKTTNSSGQQEQKQCASVWRMPRTQSKIWLNPDVHHLAEIDVHIPSTQLEEFNAVRNLTLSLWDSDLVGIGRDASGLDHKNIDVINVRKMETPVYRLYLNNKILLQKYASRRPRKDIKLDYKAGDNDIRTRKELARKDSVLKRLVNDSINEVFLFHGTEAANIPSIEQWGFDVLRCRSTYLGKCIYFAESPVKADQYTDNPNSDVCTMILARVLLGNTIVLKDASYMYNSVRPPCSSCLAINCTDEHVLDTRPFDSVVYDKPGGLFREFVVYEYGLAYPEYLITYKRVRNTVAEINYKP